MSNSKVKFIEAYKSNLGINIANTLIVGATVVAMIVFLVIGYIYLAQGWGSDIEIGFDWENEKTLLMNQWAFLFLLPICALAALAGVISVVASNNKAPITLLVLSSISTLYKFLYPVVQGLSGQERINSTVIIGQLVMFVLLFVQVYYWVRWNKMTDEGKFISASFKGKRTYLAIAFIATLFAAQFAFSVWVNGENWFTVFIDVSGSMLYLTAAILMAFGNILCFPFFLLSDINWLYWTINDIKTSENVIMIIFAYTTLIEVLAYSGLAITGFLQWFKDDFIIENGKIIKIDRTIHN